MSILSSSESDSYLSLRACQGEKRESIKNITVRKRKSQNLPKVGREKCKAPKTTVEDIQDTSVEDLQFSLQSTLEVVFKRYKKKDDEFANIEAQLLTAKEEIKQVTQERNKLSEEHENTQQMLERKIDHLRDLQTKFDRLADEKTDKCKELDGLKKILQSKDIEFTRFVKEFSGKGQGEGSSKEAGDVDGSSNCTICMEPWTESGEHNICSLSCGHFFGRSCITEWINKATLVLAKCPHCSKSASLGDLRQHYVQRICIGDEKKIRADDGKISQANK